MGMDFNVVFATSSLSSYKSAFDKDGVKYFAGQWSDSQNSQYSSIIVQVPGSQLLLELVQKTTLSFSEGEAAVEMEQRVPDSVLAEHETTLTGTAVADTTTDYIVSLVVNRAVSSKAMSELEDFYVTGMGTSSLWIPQRMVRPRNASCGLVRLSTIASPTEQIPRLPLPTQLAIMKTQSTAHTRPSLGHTLGALWTGGLTTTMPLTAGQFPTQRSSVTSIPRSRTTSVARTQ